MWIVLDNASLHKSKDTIKFIRKNSIKLISIPPYSPQLNAAEKMIALIKSKLRKSWIENELRSLKLIKRIVDGINSESWESWFKSSRIEVFHKMKTFNC